MKKRLELNLRYVTIIRKKYDASEVLSMLIIHKHMLSSIRHVEYVRIWMSSDTL